MTEIRSPEESRTHHEHMVRPQHTNSLNTLFGGELMSWVDIAAAACAQRHCRGPVVTASVDALHFFAPIRLGQLVCLDATVNYAGRTSCEIGVKVTVENLNAKNSKDVIHTTTAYLTFVGVDKDGKPIEIPQIAPKTDEDKRRYKAAELRRKMRLDLREQLKNHDLHQTI